MREEQISVVNVPKDGELEMKWIKYPGGDDAIPNWLLKLLDW